MAGAARMSRAGATRWLALALALSCVARGAHAGTPKPEPIVAKEFSFSDELNDAFVRRWQFVDGAQRRRARKTLDALALWLLPALAARGLFHALRSCRRRQTARALLARCDATMPAPGAPLKSV